jgi:hypothetical protein
MQQIAALAAPPSRPSGLISRLKRAPNSLRWKLIMAFWVLKRDWTGFVHRLQGRRIAHFMHIPKTGGTALTSVLRDFATSSDYEIVVHDAHGLRLCDLPRGEKVFLFMRDPISRFISGFYGRQRQDLPRYDGVPWEAGEEVAFRRFATPNELALALSSDDPEQRSAAAAALRSFVQLKQPLASWLMNESYLLSRKPDILFIGFQETMNEDFELLKGILNLPADTSLPADEVAAHRNPAHLDRRLDQEAVRNLRIWYADDYRLFIACKELAAQIRGELGLCAPGRDQSEPALTPVGTP